MNLFDFFSLRRDDELKCNQACNLYHFSYCTNNVLLEYGPASTNNKSSKFTIKLSSLSIVKSIESGYNHLYFIDVKFTRPNCILCKEGKIYGNFFTMIIALEKIIAKKVSLHRLITHTFINIPHGFTKQHIIRAASNHF